MKREVVTGHLRTFWSLEQSVPHREFEFTEAEAARIKAAIETWGAFGADADRRWLEPMIPMFFVPDTHV